MQVVRELCSIERRGPGTDAERRAANVLAAHLRGIGRRVRVEATHVHPQYPLVHALHAALGVAGSILATAVPAAGFGLVLVTAASAYLDLNTRLYLLRGLFFRRASQNVVSPGPRPEAPMRLLLVAHYDAGRSGFFAGERGLRLARRLGPRGRVLLGPWRLLLWGGLAPLIPILGARMAGLDPGWLDVLQLIPTVVLVVAVFLLLDIALSEIVPGAYDNASGVAAALSAAERIEADGLAHNLDVWVVLTGGGTAQAEGMRAFVRSHADDLDRARTAIVVLDSVSYGTPHYEASEGAAISTPLDPGLAEICEAISAGDPAAGARATRSPAVGDALPAAIRGRRAIAITGLADGHPPPWHGVHEDTPDRVVGASMERTTALVVALAALLSRESALIPESPVDASSQRRDAPAGPRENPGVPGDMSQA
ncbi:MAG: hypothetical protein K0S15_2277 [Solirubrobacterales bacterium]|nr:hypothetical protein [Solirubrobacterales bacterium]